MAKFPFSSVVYKVPMCSKYDDRAYADLIGDLVISGKISMLLIFQYKA